MTYLQGNVKQLEGRINNQILGVQGLNLKSDQHFTSLYSSTAGSFIKKSWEITTSQETLNVKRILFVCAKQNL